MERFSAGEIRTGGAYEADRAAIRARLASTAQQRRVDLGSDLVLVFETREVVRSALQELLRAERVSEDARVSAEIAAFQAVVPGERELAATLFVDAADPVALADRLTELTGVAASVFLEVASARVAAQADPGDEDSGAFRLLFAPDDAARAALLDGAPVRAGVDHPACRASTALTAEQVSALAADLRR